MASLPIIRPSKDQDIHSLRGGGMGKAKVKAKVMGEITVMITDVDARIIVDTVRQNAVEVVVVINPL